MNGWNERPKVAVTAGPFARNPIEPGRLGVNPRELFQVDFSDESKSQVLAIPYGLGISWS